MREHQNRKKDRVTWGLTQSLWHFLEGKQIHQSHFVPQRTDGTQPFPVLIQSTSTPFPPAADWERLDLASRCQTHLVSCSGAESRDVQHTKPLSQTAAKAITLLPLLGLLQWRHTRYIFLKTWNTCRLWIWITESVFTFAIKNKETNIWNIIFFMQSNLWFW